MAIIGIAGRIGAGKDHVGKIIQYLTADYNRLMNPIGKREHTINDFFNIPIVESNIYCNWQIKKYASKLKEIASILTDIPVDKFEDQEFKNSYLGEEWIRYGYANGFTQKNGETIMNNEACSKERYEEELRINWQTAYKHQYTVREFLQLLGTEAMRNVIHPNVWVNALMSEYDKGIITRDNDSKEEGSINNPKTPNWIITDTRFQNEAQAITDRGGIVIRVNKQEPLEFGETDKYDRRELILHPSETALDNYPFHYIISAKQGDIQSLIDQTKEILIKEKIL